MKINVTENKVSIKEEQILNENEYNIHKIQFDFSSEYTDDLVKVALFSIDNHTYKKIISNNECDIPPEVLTQRGYSILGVYAYKTEQDTLVLRYSPSPTKISVYDGSYKADAENSEPITPSEIEQYQQILQNSLQQFQNQYNALVEETEGDIQAIEDELQRKVDEGYFDGEDGFSPIAKVIQKSNGATIEIEDKNGKTTADVYNGADGKDGKDGQNGQDGKDGEDGKDAKINGKNSIEIEAGNNITIDNTETGIRINSTGGSGGTSNYNDLSNKPKINNVELSGNKSLNDLGIQPKGNYIEDNNYVHTDNNFNNTYKNKLEGLENYDDTEIKADISDIQDEQTEQNTDIEKLQEENARFKATLPTTTGEGQDITLDKTAELEFKKPPLPMGNSEQVSYEGYNIININNQVSRIDSGVEITADVEKQIIKFNGTISNTYCTSAKLALSEPLNTGVFRANFNSKCDAFIVFRASDDTWLKSIQSSNNSAIDISTLSKPVTHIQFGIEHLTSGTNVNYEVGYQLTEGNELKPYEPYVGETASPNPDYPQEITNVTGDVEVVVENKNLLDASKGINAYISSTGILVEDSSKSNFLTDYIAIKNNQNYTLSLDLTVSQFALNYYDINKNFIERNDVSAVRKTTFSHATAKYVRCVAYQSSYQFTPENMVNTYHFQLEKGTTPTNFVEHKSQTFIFPLGNEKLMLGDYLADDGIHHVRNQIVLDETKYVGTITEDGYLQFYVELTNQIAIDNANKINALSDYYKGVSRSNIMSLNNQIAANQRFIRIRDDRFENSNEFRTWLSTHNTIVEYELQEEVIVPYNSAQQRVYNEMKNAYSYDEMTIITGSSDGNKPFFAVQTYKDLNKELNNKVDKVQGKELSSNDFTDTLKEKLEGLENYDDTEIKTDISDIQNEQTEQNTDIENLQEENERLKATLQTTTGEGQDVSLNKTAELEFIKPPLPRGNSEQVQYSGKNEFNKKASHFDGDYASFTELETGVRMTATGSGNYIWTRFVIKDLSDYVGKTVRCKASIKASANNEPNITIGLCASNGENRTQKASTSTSGELFSFEVPQFSDENTYLYIVFYANAGGSATSGDYVDYTDVILTIDNSDMAYEPYVRTELQAHHQTIHKK